MEKEKKKKKLEAFIIMAHLEAFMAQILNAERWFR